MSNYTPTTEEVKDALPSGRLYAQFDRWLAEVKAQERKAERKRIIALLNNNHTYKFDCVGCEAIALIEREEQ